MNSTRKIVFTCALTMAVVFLWPAASSAQARGAFTLPHDVVWQGATVPAGDYQFSLDSRGPGQLLTLFKRDGARAGFMMMVTSISTAKGAPVDRLILVPSSGKSFVSIMELPEFDMTLHFKVPKEGTEKEVALAGDNPVPTRLR